MKHLTVRRAWHDNKWNGKICTSPQRNVYYVGAFYETLGYGRSVQTAFAGAGLADLSLVD